MRVSDVLASKGNDAVMTISPDSSITDLLDRLAEHNIGALVVSRDGATIDGIVSERDIVRKLRGVDDPRTLTVESIMTADVITCTPDDAVTDLMKLMTERRFRHVPILDDDGALAGVVSIGDAVKFRMAQLEFERDQLNQYVARG
ncbi:CBS domain-containing protein [Solicola gregarius]|uniref:CBS domain-containing protein n=1 Tax=Solicola gregarius TaxID=2908642 RepID=A0AA46TJ30_9ACTN|nr:CBS domain-containing protein [Solicola gregarius]UYM06048.1 CBS domain-containing protein [Solicola gregarius]